MFKLMPSAAVGFIKFISNIVSYGMRAVFILYISIRSACSNEIHFDMLFPREIKILIDIAANYHNFVKVSDAMCPLSNRNDQFRSKNGRFVRPVGLD